MYIRKCFRLGPSRKCGNFQNVGTTAALISCIDYAVAGVYHALHTSYLFECEVLGRLFTFGLATTFYLIDGISLTLFVYS